MNIGIIGQGYVGSAVKIGFENYYKIFTYDKFDSEKSSCQSVKELVKTSDIIFVCVPTPMNKETGECHIDIVDEVCKQIDHYSNNSKIIVIKSTIPPGSTDFLDKKYKNVDIIFNPEFLTEANFIEDFKNQKHIILGGEKNTNILSDVYSKVFPNANIIITSSTTAEMVKYMTNAYLATKVSFANEIKQICDKVNVDYNEVMRHAILDDRLGKSHWNVPGPDGEFGFGGHCLPKDLNALLYVAKKYQLDVNVLKSVLLTNDNVRKNRDWEDMIGRAIISGEKNND